MIEGRIFVAIFLLLVLSLSAQSIDPSTEACTNLTLNNNASRTDPSVTPPPFYIVTDLIEKYRGQYTAGQTYDITLMGINATFTDFIVQARSGADGSLIGTFVKNCANIQLLNCSGDPDSTITHTNNTDKSSLSFQWTAPGGAGGTVKLRYSIFTDYQQIYYVNLNAADYRLSCQFTPTPIGEHSLIFRQPENCLRESCDYFLGLNQNMDNPSFLDVYLEGNAAGWIAVGFTLSAQLGRDDVLGCRVDSGSVTVVDTWNPSAGQIANVLDATQAGLCVQATSFTNNRVTCQFSRTIDISDTGQDYDLNATTYWLLFGRHSNAQTSGNNLAKDSSTSLTFSTKRYNPVRDNNINNNTNMGCPPTPNENITYTFMFRSLRSDFYFAARVNPNNPLYVDMRIEGTANGWVGVGFTPNRTMDDADVLGCVRNPSDNMVAVVDSYNPVPRYEDNRLDTNQDGVCIYNNQFSNGRLICSFSRRIAPVNPADDFDLSTPLFQLYGTSNTGGPSSAALSKHLNTPDITTSTVVLTTDSGASTPDITSFTFVPRDYSRKAKLHRIHLLKVHGILMLLAWPLLVVSAIFFAAWMKPALPNGEWFQVHCAFMIVSLVLTGAGFVFAFVANAKNEAVRPGLISFACSKNTSHFVIGFIVFILQIINPIIAICRCKPNSSKRWIFKISHATLIGFAAELLALVNVGLGIALFESKGCSAFEASQYRLFWLYIAFVCFLVILHISLFFIFTLSACIASPEKRSGLAPSLIKCFFILSTNSFKKTQDIELTDPRHQERANNEPPPRKEPSKDSSIRLGALAIFVPVTLSVMVALIVMIVIE